MSSYPLIVFSAILFLKNCWTSAIVIVLSFSRASFNVVFNEPEPDLSNLYV